MNSKIIIRVLGRAGVGKSTMMAFIEKSLIDAGFRADQMEVKYSEEVTHSRAFAVRWDVLRDPRWQTHVSIEEAPLRWATLPADIEKMTTRGADLMVPAIARILEEHCSTLCMDDEEDRAEAAKALSVWVAASINVGIRQGMEKASSE